MNVFTALGDSRFISLESYRADNTLVRTPVWITAEDDKLYCWTVKNTGKVGRIGKEPRVRLAACTARGDIRGEWVDCGARILESRADHVKQMRRMRAKYGLLFLPFQWWPRLTKTATVVIEISKRD